MKILLFGASGKVGSVLGPALAEAGHEVQGVGSGETTAPAGYDVAIDFTRPDAARANVERCLTAGIPCIVGTTGLQNEDMTALDGLAREH